MHFHVPKPLHGWREFAGEVLIVVIGVLIALGAEQLVEKITWRDRVDQAHQQLRYEVGDNLKLLRWRNQGSRCVERRLDELGIILNKAAVDGRLPPVGPISGPGWGLYPTGVWENQQAAQTGTHLSAGQLAALSRGYRQIELVRQTNNEETQTWLALASMVGPGRPVSLGTIDRLDSALVTARLDNRRFGTLLEGLDTIIAGTLGSDFPQLDPLNRFDLRPYSNQVPICQSIPDKHPRSMEWGRRTS